MLELCDRIYILNRGRHGGQRPPPRSVTREAIEAAYFEGRCGRLFGATRKQGPAGRSAAVHHPLVRSRRFLERQGASITGLIRPRTTILMTSSSSLRVLEFEPSRDVLRSKSQAGLNEIEPVVELADKT